MELVLSRLPTAKPNGDGWLVCCPAHEDRSPSLSINQGEDGRVLLKCFAGCSHDAIVGAMGLESKDLFVPRDSRNGKPHTIDKATPKPKSSSAPKGKRFATADAAKAACLAMMGKGGHEPGGEWEYHDASGKPVAWVLRFNGSDGSKEFRPVSLHDDGGWYIKAPATPRPLYGLPDLAGATTVYVCEGEKAADAARSIGLVATTSIGGSQAPELTDWTPLVGKTVVFLPDNDDAGRKYPEAIAGILHCLDASTTIKIVELPNLPPKGDVVEWIESRGDAAEPETMRQELKRLVNEADAVEPKPARAKKPQATSEAIVVRLSDVQEQQVEWLWPNRIPLGKLTLLAGDPGLGKSFVTVDIAARVSTGTGWPDCFELRQPVGSVILFNCEDDIADTVLPRLNRAGGDPSKVIALQGVTITDAETGQRRQRGFSLDVDLPKLIEVLEVNRDVRLVVIDPVSAYCGATDSHKNADIRAMLAPMADMASKYRVAVVMVTHLSKGSGGKAVYRAMGSLAFAAAARAVWHVAKDHDDDKRRLILLAKINISEEATGLAYRLQDGAVCWEEAPVVMTADEHLEKETQPERKPRGNGEQGEAMQQAKGWLVEKLTGCSMLATVVKQLADDADIAPASLKRAKKLAKVKSQRIGFGEKSVVWWSLPSNDDETCPADVDEAEAARLFP